MLWLSRVGAVICLKANPAPASECQIAVLSFPLAQGPPLQTAVSYSVHFESLAGYS